jgi:uncharacterized protein YecE (DUF72 family)
MRIGTAGWSIPRELHDLFPGAASHLERYARVLDAAEINSTFHRSHRASTYERWAKSVPARFRFSVKLPRTITHDARLAGTGTLLDSFLREIEPLRPKVGCLLVQLPPSLQWDAGIARRFVAALRSRYPGPIALEPRHESWFVDSVDVFLERERITRVAADPPKASRGGEPGGWRGLAYYRLHGSPRVYYSSYDDAFLDPLATRLRQHRRAGTECWCILDNTTLGAGTRNALELAQKVRAARAARNPADD